MLILLLLLIPCFGSILLLFINDSKVAASVNIGTSAFSFFASILLALELREEGSMLFFNKWFYVDYFSMSLILMSALVGTTTAIYCRQYLFNETLSARLSIFKLRYFYSLYQFFFFIAVLIFISNNLGIVWVSMECATFCTVLLVSVSRSAHSLEAAWKYLIICGLGLAQALLGTILLFFATESVLSANDALLWSEITAISHQLSPPIVGLSFVFVLIGYGTKAGFVPLHNWLPDAYGESIAPVLSLLSGVLINATLYTIFRFKVIVDGSFETEFAGHFLIGFGLLNIIVSSLFMLRQRELKKLYAYSSIEHVGIICFAFGIGTPLAIFAGLLHMLSHSLAKSAAFFSGGSAIQLRSSKFISEITGLAQDSPVVGWGLLLSTFALIGLPPFSLFVSEVLIIFATIKYQICLALPLVVGMLIAFSAMILHVQRMVLSSSLPNPSSSAERVSIFPVYAHLMLLATIGLLVPYVLLKFSDPIVLLMSHFA